MISSGEQHLNKRQNGSILYCLNSSLLFLSFRQPLQAIPKLYAASALPSHVQSQGLREFPGENHSVILARQLTQ